MYLIKKISNKFTSPIRQLRFNLNNPIFKMSNSNTKFDRIYHFHIRKCGGTSFNLAFSSYPNGDNKNYNTLANSHENKATFNSIPIVGWNIKHLKRGDYWYGFSHSEFERIFPLPKNTFTFCFLRDPVERLLSYYNTMKLLETHDQHHPAFKEEGQWLGNSFYDFIEKIPRQHLQNQLFMFSRNFDINFALKNLKQIDFIGITGEDEEKLVAYFRENFDIDLDYIHARKSINKYNLDENEKKLLKSKLEEEHIFFEKAKLYIKKN